jgi:hypothetical protein
MRSEAFMRPEQELSPQQLLKQERSFSDVCVPEMMSLAKQNKHSVTILVQDLPRQWHFSDRVLVAVFPSFREDVEAFYAGNGKSMTLIPPAELEALFRHPDYSVNGGATWIIAGDRAIADASMAA